VTTVEVLGQRLPCGGGGYFRIFPYWLFRSALRRVNQADRQSAVFYCHPWEVDPGQPRVAGLSFKSRFRHYTNLSRMESRLRRLLRDFRWGRMDEVFVGA
jgi:polysaccharide deacetylase family protein (PEP-CTERM system associated)